MLRRRNFLNVEDDRVKDCTVVLTCCGGLISPSQIQSFRVVDERKIRIIGTDMSETAVGRYMVDKFYTVPPGSSPEYTNAMLKICKRGKVDVVFPCSNEESLALAEHKSLFEKIGTVIATSDYETLKTVYDKGRAFQFLKKRELPCPKFRIVKSLDGFINAAQELGFPEKLIFMKPILARGGRGARVLTNESNLHTLLNEKPGSLHANFYEVLRTLKTAGDNFPELVLMEYLPGEYYSVDFLAKEGEALVIVPKIRVIGTPSQTLVGVVKKNPVIEKMTRDICKAFNFNYNVNIEMKYSETGMPLPYDINPRVAASVAFCTAAGANLLYYALKLALGEEIPDREIKDGVRMVRYLKELYVSESGDYNL